MYCLIPQSISCMSFIQFDSLEDPGVESGRGQNDTLRVFAVSFHNIQDGIFVDAKIAGNPTI
jgi:hypothetical protein